ncbi:MAG: AAA family ATPase [Cyanobacterium sp. T60_A2020_053]|nr:AAA family ATPase [Cyanobacterium sp. T60_A2020_053]
MVKIFSPKQQNPNFLSNKLIGIDEQKKTLEAFCQFVWSQDWQEQSKTLHFMSTILLYGPPGTGKTSLLKEIANNFEINGIKYYRESLDLLVDKELGETSKAIKELFDQIIEQGKCGKKVFLQLDDIDSVLSSRFMSNESSGVRRGVNTFLIQLDELLQIEFEYTPIIAATTNMFSNLDSAIKRRFSLKIKVDPILNRMQLEDLLSPIEKIIGSQLQINYDLIESITKEKKLTPYDIILVMQKLFLNSLIGNEIKFQQFTDELNSSESSKVSFEKQEQAYSLLQ